MVIAVDLDEVVADTLQAFLAYYNFRHGTCVSREDFATSDWGECLKLRPSELEAMIRSFTQSEFHSRIRPVVGAVEILARLSSLYPLHMVTSRWGPLAEVTQPWLNAHFPDRFVAVHYSRTSHPVASGNGSLRKSEICREIGASLIIEDCPVHAGECLSSGIAVILMERPWNRSFEEKSALRVKSWKEASDVLVSALFDGCPRVTR